jgi:hypothetical protein
MALDGVRGDVTQPVVGGLLQARRPAILDATDPAEVAKFEARVVGAAVQVVLLVGTDPDAGPLRDLAVEAIATETASQIEYAEFPEQQGPGDIGRGYYLHQRYLELLALLRGYVESGTVTGVVGVPKPVGSFPAARAYPDPAERPTCW